MDLSVRPNHPAQGDEALITDYTGASAIVIGGSIGGLTTALLLRGLGFTVDISERTPTALDGRGSGIVLQPDTVRWFTERSTQDLADLSTSTSYVQYLDRTGDLGYREERTWTYTSWGMFYRALLADFGTEHYHYGEYACGFDQFDGRASVRFVSGRVESADLVVFADGVTSVARERFDADAGLRYSGYIGWRGTFPLHDLGAKTVKSCTMPSPTTSSPTRISPCIRSLVRTDSTSTTG